MFQSSRCSVIDLLKREIMIDKTLLSFSLDTLKYSSNKNYDLKMLLQIIVLV